jgi:hypothetical protein
MINFTKKKNMKYFKMFLMWCGFITIASLFGEYIISRELNGFLQLLSFVGLVGIFIFTIYETVNLFKNN